MIIDKIGCSYDTFEELIERESAIKDRIEQYIEDKPGYGYTSETTMAKDNKFYLTFTITKKDD